MAVGGAQCKPSIRVRRGVLELKQDFAVSPVLDVWPIRDERDRLCAVRNQHGRRARTDRARAAAGGWPGRRCSGESAWWCCGCRRVPRSTSADRRTPRSAAASRAYTGCRPSALFAIQKTLRSLTWSLGPPAATAVASNSMTTGPSRRGLNHNVTPAGTSMSSTPLSGGDVSGFFGFDVPVGEVVGEIVLVQRRVRRRGSAAREEAGRGEGSATGCARGCRRAHRASGN